jgi:hypothetical protein
MTFLLVAHLQRQSVGQKTIQRDLGEAIVCSVTCDPTLGPLRAVVHLLVFDI